MEELAKYLRAMLLLEIWNTQQATERAGTAAPKLELLLADSGFATNDISTLLAKSPAAVAKAISRGRAARRSGLKDEQSEVRNDD